MFLCVYIYMNIYVYIYINKYVYIALGHLDAPILMGSGRTSLEGLFASEPSGWWFLSGPLC